MVEPLNRWLQKGVKPVCRDPADELQPVLQAFRQSLVERPVVELPLSHGPFPLDTDSSVYQVNLTLLQQYDDDKQAIWVTIGYWLRSLNGV